LCRVEFSLSKPVCLTGKMYLVDFENLILAHLYPYGVAGLLNAVSITVRNEPFLSKERQDQTQTLATETVTCLTRDCYRETITLYCVTDKYCY